MNKELKKYYKVIKKELNCPKALRVEFLSNTKHMVNDLLSERPDASFDEIKEFLGEPDELAATFRENVDSGIVEWHTKKKLYIKRGGILLLAALLIGTIVFSIYGASVRMNAEVTKESTIIIYENMEE